MSETKEYLGCGNNPCTLEPVRGGQHTNSGCRCLRELPTEQRIKVEKKLHELREWQKEAADWLEHFLAHEFNLDTHYLPPTIEKMRELLDEVK